MWFYNYFVGEIKSGIMDKYTCFMSTVRQFCKASYTFQYEEGGTVNRLLLVICEKIDIEEHLLIFLKQINS